MMAIHAIGPDRVGGGELDIGIELDRPGGPIGLGGDAVGRGHQIVAPGARRL